jgi:outer membrane protein assembly factor BamA
MFRTIILSTFIGGSFAACYAQDTTPAVSLSSDTASVSHFWERGIIGKVYNYFCDSNKDHPDKKFDISFIGGPHYSSEQGFGLGLVGSGRYRAGELSDTLTPYSNVSLKLDVTTGKMYEIGAEGYHIFKHDKYRINYDAKFYSFADKLWGIGYHETRNDSNESNYNRLQLSALVDLVVKLKDGMFIGPAAQFNYTNAQHIDKPELLRGQHPKIYTTGIGLTYVIDTRDMPTAATRGVYVRLYGMVIPRFLANKYRYSLVQLTASHYRSVWRGGVLAGNFHTRLTWGNTPWCQLSYFGGSKTMRGYWEERYRDKMESDITVELRQKVWGRHGFAVWTGAGAVYPKFSQFRFEEILPNYGVGYRWEFKKGVNVRLDVGFGKHERGVNFSINEAF